jgi:hypothetical protein
VDIKDEGLGFGVGQMQNQSDQKGDGGLRTISTVSFCLLVAGEGGGGGGVGLPVRRERKIEREENVEEQTK